MARGEGSQSLHGGSCPRNWRRAGEFLGSLAHDWTLTLTLAGLDRREVGRTSTLAWDEQDGRRDDRFRGLDRSLRLGFARNRFDRVVLGAFLSFLPQDLANDVRSQLTRYTIATILAALLEAASKQNDNLIIPIYMWSMVTLLDV